MRQFIDDGYLGPAGDDRVHLAHVIGDQGEHLAGAGGWGGQGGTTVGAGEL